MVEFVKEFMAWVKDVLIIVTPLALAYIAWRQSQDSAALKTVNNQLVTVKEDVAVVKAVGNSTLREAMAATATATATTAAVTGSEGAKVAAEVARQRLAEHDVGQSKGREEKEHQEQKAAPKPSGTIAEEMHKVASGVATEMKKAAADVVGEVKKSSAEVINEVKKAAGDDGKKG